MKTPGNAPDYSAGRQQNRRVELFVSGEAIGDQSMRQQENLR
jgi:hypothetical protein